jgi:hypothetical protein
MCLLLYSKSIVGLKARIDVAWLSQKTRQQQFHNVVHHIYLVRQLGRPFRDETSEQVAHERVHRHASQAKERHGHESVKQPKVLSKDDRKRHATNGRVAYHVAHVLNAQAHGNTQDRR